MMGEFFDFLGEDGVAYRVEFELVDETEKFRRYGVRAKMFCGGILQDEAVALGRFLTRTEAEQTMRMLCKFQVTPCTLCDIV